METAMPAIDLTKRHPRTTYHVGPWRSIWGWALFLPLSIGCALGAIFADKADEKAGLWVGALIFALIIIGLMTMIRRARLEICRDGITLRQIGYRLEASWPDVIAFRGDRGREGFITSNPVGGRGANTLAAASSLGPYGMYDSDQIDLLDEHRLIPIDPFAWHLRHGPMRREIEEYAPHLAGDLARLDDPPIRKSIDRRTFRVTAVVIAASIALTLVLIALGERAQEILLEAVYAIVYPLMALSSAIATRQMFRRRSWLFTFLMAAMTLVMLGWTVHHWGVLLSTLGRG